MHGAVEVRHTITKPSTAAGGRWWSVPRNFAVGVNPSTRTHKSVAAVLLTPNPPMQNAVEVRRTITKLSTVAVERWWSVPRNFAVGVNPSTRTHKSVAAVLLTPNPPMQNAVEVRRTITKLSTVAVERWWSVPRNFAVGVNQSTRSNNSVVAVFCKINL